MAENILSRMCTVSIRVMGTRDRPKRQAAILVIGACLIFVWALYSRSSIQVGLPVYSMERQEEVLLERIKYIKSMDEVNSILESSASSGKTFSGKPIRRFNPNDIKFRNKRYPDLQADHGKTFNCKRWAVLTTIFTPPSEAVRRFMYMKNWCVVIVGDKNKPDGYVLASTTTFRNIIFLSDSDQNKINSKFVESLPWRSFGRKNVGYLYAIAHGAQVIWDFDDDNMLKFWIEGASPSDRLWIENFSDLKLDKFYSIPLSLVTAGLRSASTGSAQLFNPYPILGAPSNICWPRGFPLTLIRKSSDQGHFKVNLVEENIEKKVNDIGVLQSLADHEPDVDALYRLIQGTPFTFKRPAKGSDTKRIHLLSEGVYSPFNAQATLYFRNAFLALYLPVTVPGRVSDIWRSYLAQALLSLHNITIGFLPRPIVDQDRNDHSLLADLESEIALYTQTNALVAFLDEWRTNKTISGDNELRSLEDLLEELYIETYERGFIEIDDVLHIQNWILAFGSVRFNSIATKSKNTKQYKQVDGNMIEREIINIDVGKSIIVSDSIEPEECKTIKNRATNVTFWTSDLHDGTRLDSPSLLASLGQRFVVAGYKRRQTPYPAVFDRPGFIVPEKISNEILSYRINTQATDDFMNNNFKFYENDLLFKNTDAFYCSFYAAMCQIWMPLNKTKSIVFLAGHRYNLGRCSLESWTKLNEQLWELQNNDPVRVDHKHIIAGASRYDYEYLKHYTGLKDSIKLISSFSGFYTDGNKFNPTEPEILFVSYGAMFTDITVNVVEIRKKYPRYQLSDLVKHKAIIYVPYSVMSFKLTEFYSLNIPLFVPSAKYFKTNGNFGSDRTSTTAPYCDNDPDLWWKMPSHPSSPHSYNPNAEYAQDPEAEMYWLQFSDFYDWPHIQYFDDGSDLNRKLQTADFIAIHKSMKAQNEIRKHELLQQWCKLLPQIKKI
ncbi:uncharacterized protein LOC127838925 [Dreissena polymorpha]|nr:uncharacterized protein LOC127838925 [Dreissena polymorpha]